MTAVLLLFSLSLHAGDEPSGKSPVRGKPPAAGDWATFRGDPQFHGYRDASISEAPKLVWTHDTKSMIESTAAIVGRKVYAGTSDGDLIALELFPKAKSGRSLWKFRAEGGIRSSPGVRSGRLFFGDDYGIFYALDAQTGKQVWRLDTEGAEIIASANFDDHRVLFGSYDGFLYCLHSQTGKVIWKLETGGPIHSSPAIVQGKTFVTGCDEVLRVVDVEAGKEVLEMQLGSYTASSPVVVGSHLYVGTFGNELLAVDWREKTALWRYKHPQKEFPFYSSAAVGKGRLVIGGRDKMIHCVDLKTGKSRWTFPTGARVECSPVIAGNRVICGSSDKNLYVLDLDSGREVWKYAADGAFVASPALARGRLVIGADNGLLYCFDVVPEKATNHSGGGR